MAERSRPSLGRRPKIGGDGYLEVFVADEQTLPIDVERWSLLVREVLVEEGIRGNAEMSLIFVDEASIAELNEQFLGKSTPTDVLAFPIDGELEMAAGSEGPSTGPSRSPLDLGDLPLLLGDVVVCPAVAAEQAPTHAGTFDDELALLIVHGVLHILGHDHAEADETAVMRAREVALLEAYHWHGPTPVGFRQDQE